MADRIELNIDALKEKANMMDQYKTQQQEVMRKMTNLVMNLNEVLKGQVQNAFLSRYVGMQLTFEKLSEAIHEYADLIREDCDVMDSKDKDIMSRINGI